MYTNISARIRKIFLGLVLGMIVLALSSAGGGSPVAHAQDVELLQQAGQYTDRTIPFPDGLPIEEHTINGPIVPPAGFEFERQAVALPKSDGETIEAIGLPGSVWVFGCSASAAGEIAQMDDTREIISTVIQGQSSAQSQSTLGFPNIYAGPTNGGVMPPNNNSWPTWTDRCGGTYASNPLVASRNGLDGRVIRGTVDDYWDCYDSKAADPYITKGWVQHKWGDAIGDYMYTSQSAHNNVDGATKFYTYDTLSRPFTCDVMASQQLPDGTLGMKNFYQARGYSVTDCYNQPTDNIIAGGFSFAQFKAEIDGGRPVLLQLDGGPSQQGHTIVGIGYDAATNKIFLHDGWDYNTHEMIWGTSYSGMSLATASIMHPTPVDIGNYTISGNAGVPNATIAYTGGSTKTGSDGYYSFPVSPGWSGTVTPSKPGYTFNPPFRQYVNVSAYQMAQHFTSSIIPGSNLIKDPSFELGSPNPYWIEASSNFGTPLCTVAECGDGARTGSVWGWFGGTQQYPNETASLSQSVMIPNGSSASLDFYLWIGDANAGSDMNDVFTVKVDGKILFSANATQINSYAAYIPISVDVSNYANGASHTIMFSSVTSGQVVAFHLDDVFLAVTPSETPPQIFSDVPSTHPYSEYINILFANGYTGGCSTNPLMFCPDMTMDRAQSAVFMLRGNFGSGYTPVTPTHFFKDNWSKAVWAEGWAESMYLEGLTAGCVTSPLKFCPYDRLTNVQAAVFGLRLKYGMSYMPPPATGTVFADMTNMAYWGISWAEQAYADGLLPACGTDAGSGKPKFCPNALVNRGFGAYLIVTAKNLTMP